MNTLIARYISPFLKGHLSGLSAALVLLLNDLNNGAVHANDVYAIVGAYLGAGALVAIAPNVPFVAPTAPEVPAQDTADVVWGS